MWVLATVVVSHLGLGLLMWHRVRLTVTLTVTVTATLTVTVTLTLTHVYIHVMCKSFEAIRLTYAAPYTQGGGPPGHYRERPRG